MLLIKLLNASLPVCERGSIKRSFHANYELNVLNAVCKHRTALKQTNPDSSISPQLHLLTRLGHIIRSHFLPSVDRECRAQAFCDVTSRHGNRRTSDGRVLPFNPEYSGRKGVRSVWRGDVRQCVDGGAVPFRFMSD